MKAPYIEILDYISALYQMGVLSNSERNEAAKLIGACMKDETMNSKLLKHLESKFADTEVGSTERQYLIDAVRLVRSAPLQYT